MVHDSQIEAAYRPEDGSYSFYSCFEPLKEITARADLAVINLETVLAGEELGYTGYPAFNTPESLARALKEAGFDLVCTANNHSLDRGETGVLKTLEHLEAAGLKSFGTYSSGKPGRSPSSWRQRDQNCLPGLYLRHQRNSPAGKQGIPGQYAGP